MKHSSIVVIGKGKLGSILIERMATSRMSREFTIIGVTGQNDYAQFVATAAAVVIAVRPDQLEAVAETIRPVLRPDLLIISLVSARSFTKLSSLLGNFPMVRATTNVGAKVGKASSVFVLHHGCCFEHGRLAEKLFANWGKVYRRTQERILPAAVIAAGCMPAVIVHDVQENIDACVGLGLDRQLSQSLVLDCLEAVLTLYRANPAGGLEAIQKAVTTPLGFTAEILKQLALVGRKRAFGEAYKKIVEGEKQS